MTPRQKEVLDFIQSYISNRGFAPTYEEIIQATNIGYKSYLNRVLKNLKEQGKIEITSYKARGISICKETVKEKEQIETLQKQLDIAVKALRGVRVWANTGNGGEQAVKKLCNEALKEIEELNK